MDVTRKIRSLTTRNKIHVSTDEKTLPSLSVESIELHKETAEKKIYLKSTITNKLFKITFNKRTNKKILTTPDGSENDIIDIRPGEGTILKNRSKLQPHLPSPVDARTKNTDSHRANRDPDEIDSTEIKTVGNCPICECITVKTDHRIICTGCGKWCNKTQWEAYENHTPAHNNTVEQQTEITDTWN